MNQNSKEKQCLQCGSIKIRKKYSDGRLERPSHLKKRKFCGEVCRKKFSYKKTRKTYICLACNKKFTKLKCYEKYGEIKFCSTGCRDVSQTTERVSLECSNCKATFKVPRWHKKNAPCKFCSYECYWESSIGEGNKRWKGGRAHAIQKYTNKRRLLVKKSKEHYSNAEWINLKKEFKNICLSCGRSEPEVKLSVDHVVPLSKGGTNSIANIQPLCVSCNCKKNARTIDYRVGWSVVK